MTPQERQLVDDLFTRLAGVENTPRDPAAAAAIAEGLRHAPNALYTLVQTVLVQDEALKRANDHIQQLEGGGAPDQAASGGFLDQMRDTFFGKPAPSGSVPNVRPPPIPAGRPAWNTGETLQQTGQAGRLDQGRFDQGPSRQPYGAPPQPQAGGGSFLGTAAAAAAGAVGGGLLLNSIRSIMGGGEAHAASSGLSSSSSNPWGSSSDQSSSNLAREAGVNDVGSQQQSNPSQSGSFDQAQADVDPYEEEGDIDSEDFDDFDDFDDGD